MTRTWLTWAFCLLQIVCFVRATGLYSVVGPGTIRSNFKYNVAVSLHKADGPSQIKVGITGPSYNETKTIEVQPMSTQNVEFDIPKLKDGDYNLTATGLSGVVFENSTKLNYADYKPSIFIQTDKATYKPGDLVQFRVVFLDQNTKPAKVEVPIMVSINDGAQNRLKQWKNVELTKGVYTGEYQLSEQPVLGNWLLEVKMGDENTQTKSFEVAKYVLPKFEVTIDMPKDVARADGAIKGTVRSKYTYGKSVKGKATVSIEPSYHYYARDSVDDLKATKTIDVDGKGHFEFDLVKDLNLRKDNTYVPPLKVFASMEEELTGNKQNATATVNLHESRYRIVGIDTPYTFHAGKPITYKLVVKNLDDSPVQDKKNKAKLIVEPPRSYIQRGIGFSSGETITEPKPKQEKTLEFESNLDDNGIATFEFTLPESNHTFYSVKCEYLEATAYLSSLSKFTQIEETPELLKIHLNSKTQRLGQEASFEVKSSEFIPYFVYVIVARGNILKSEHIDVPEGRKSHIVKFTPTFEMIPKATIFVHYIFNNNLRFEETAIEFEKNFENSIQINAQPQAKPGEDVKLKIQTDPDSYVGLLGVDQSVLLLKSGNDFSKDDIFSSLSTYDSNTPWMRGYGRYPGQTSGLVTMTNANYPYNEEYPLHFFAMEDNGEIVAMAFELDSEASASIDYAITELPLMANADETQFIVKLQLFGIGRPFDGPVYFALASLESDSVAAGASIAQPLARVEKPLQVRKEFPENWIFEELKNTDTDGFTLSKKIPDTITSWVITGFSLNPKTGFALTEHPSKIQVFQPFFVSINLPYSVKRGEVIAIPVIIFNYMDKTLDVEVTMDNIDGEYEFTEATNEVLENPIDEIKRVKRVTVPSSTGKSVSFMIRPKKVGLIALKISAISPLAGDAIQQNLKVEPEGVTQFANRAVFINLKDKPEYEDKISVDIPKEAVPDSEYIEFSVVGDLLGPTIKNLDKLVRMPYGCGEQNMVNFVPNILVLKYLETIKQNMPTVIEKAKKFLEIGYQRELTYKHDDGSYSAFGKSDKAGSTWLTAYVVRSFYQAKKFTDIDDKIIMEGLEFLASTQAENGSFVEKGKLFDSAHQNELGLTSFVLLAFLEVQELGAEYQPNIEKAMKYILENADKTDDQYALSIAAAALQKAKNSESEKVLAKLESQANQENDRKWWSKEKETKKKTDEPYYWRPHSNDVEITSYIALALLEKGTAESVLPIIKWLISQRNSNGGFSSTQDTVVGLQALIKFAEKTGSGSGEMQIDFISNGGTQNKGQIKVDKDNALVLQTHVLPKSARSIDFTAKGSGSSMVQLSYRYNLAEKDKEPSFKVKSKVKENTPPSQLILELCAEYVPLETDDKQKESNMAVMEVALPSGYTADAESFAKIEAVDRVKRTETKNSDSTIVVYFDGLPPNDVKCIPVEASKTHAVAKQKPAAVSIYDYYDTNRRATEYYEVKSSLCDICEGDDCGSGCKKA